MNLKNKKLLIFSFVIVSVVSMIMSSFVTIALTNNVSSTSYDDLYAEIVNSYDGDIDNSYMKESIIAGIVQGLNDPHSSYIYKSDLEAFNNDLSSEFEGIGIMYTVTSEGEAIVTDTFEGGSAKNAGIYPGDIIREVNSTEITSENSKDVGDLIKSKSSTVLKYYRPSEDKTDTVTIKNATVEQPTVSSKIINHNNIDYGYIKISSFSENTGNEFLNTLSELESKNIDSLILDVRNNSGGYVKALSTISENIFSDKKPYLITKEGSKVVEELYAPKDNSKSYKIIGIQNENSASASEILLGDIKELNNSDIVGVTTYGKGSVQAIKELGSGYGALRITTQHWFSPDGNTIDKTGIKPTIEVKEADNTNVEQIILSEKEMLGSQGENDKKINTYLNALGYNTDINSLVYSKDTENAVKEFQKKNKLKETGVVDYLTAYAISDQAKDSVNTYEFDSYLKAAIDQLEK